MAGDADGTVVTEPMPADVLIAGLAQSDDARLHMALIAILLYQPEIATAVPEASALLSQSDQTRLRLFYTATVLLQRIHAEELRHHLTNWEPLPDYFSASLNLDLTAPLQKQLQQLGRRHQELSGIAANWSGSYQYAANRLLTRLAREMAWAV